MAGCHTPFADISRRFRSAFEDTAVGMALNDKQGRFMRANPAFCRMLGYAEHEMLEKTFADITHPDDLEESKRNVRSVWQGDSGAFSIGNRERASASSALCLS